MVYFIVGPRGVGKTYLTDKLNKAYSIDIFDTGPILRSCYRSQQTSLSFSEWINCGKEEYGDDFEISRIFIEIAKRIYLGRDTIICGNRCVEGIRYLIEHLQLSEYKIIFLDASNECLKSNLEKRERRKISNEELNYILEGENAMGLFELEKYVRNNNGIYLKKKSNNDFSYEYFYEVILKGGKSDENIFSYKF